MKILLLSLFLSLPVTAIAIAPENIFQNDHLFIEKIIWKNVIDSFELKSISPLGRFSKITSDSAGRISKNFIIPKFLRAPVLFWFNIYTQYNADFVVIHDKEDVSIVYDVLDFSDITKHNVGKHIKAAIQTQFVLKRVREIRKTLRALAKGKRSKDSKTITRGLKTAGIQIPRNRKKRLSFYRSISYNLRAQTGQKDNINLGIQIFRQYEPFIVKALATNKLPPELIAIPFLESSFNVHAVSSAKAVGVWQFMRRVSRYFMIVNKHTDHRKNPLISTVGAIHLLKQNKMILKQWDLAIVAYNSGTKHLIKARRKLLRKKKKKLSLKRFITKYKHPHIGFASKNYYSEFLSLVYAISYREKLYDSYHNKHFKVPSLAVYISKCSFRPKTLFKHFGKNFSRLRNLNLHLKKINHRYDRGTIVVSDYPLSKKFFVKQAFEKVVKRYPKKWHKLVKGYSCSIK